MHWEVGAAPACKNLSRSSWKTLWPHLQGPGSLLKQSWSPDIIKDIILVQFSRLSLTLINGAPPCLALMPEMGRPSRAMSELCDFAAFFPKDQQSFFPKEVSWEKFHTDILDVFLLSAHLASRLSGYSLDFLWAAPLSFTQNLFFI